MIKQIDIRHFRAFQKVTIPECAFINLIVGDNGSGKTSLLEALFLAGGNSPELAMRTKIWRGFSFSGSGGDSEVHENLWSDLFFENKITEDVWIRMQGTYTRTLTIKRVSGGAPIQSSKMGPQIVYDGVPSFQFHWKGPTGFDSVKTPRIEDGKLHIGGGGETPVKVAFFAANQTVPTAETVNRFSQISKAGNKSEVLAQFARLFDDIEDMSIEINGAVPMIYAKTQGARVSLPINLMSSGMSKLAAVLFAIPSVKGGYLLIDEIEGGFHYKKLPLVWKAIAKVARAYDVQIFATTHSSECIKAVAAFSEIEPSDFSLIRTVRTNGQSKVRQFSGDEFANAVAEDIEVR
jgi:AAA15 family ATPase/GTPase